MLKTFNSEVKKVKKYVEQINLMIGITKQTLIHNLEKKYEVFLSLNKNNFFIDFERTKCQFKSLVIR